MELVTLKILSFATDGQWIKLMLRDSKDKPLTVFQFQKDICNSTQSLSKQELIKRIAETNKVNPIDYFQTVQMLKGNSGELEVSSVDYALSLITTPNDKEMWS